MQAPSGLFSGIWILVLCLVRPPTGLVLPTSCNTTEEKRGVRSNHGEVTSVRCCVASFFDFDLTIVVGCHHLALLFARSGATGCSLSKCEKEQ